MARRACSVLAATFVVVTVFASFAGCTVSTSSSGACTDTSTAGPCTGTFPCGNSGIQLTCDKATQVCVLQPGMVNCETFTGAAGTCPSAAAAAAQFGCNIPNGQTCSGSSTEGVTINCE